MTSLSTRLDRIEALSLALTTPAVPVFILPADCQDHEAFFRQCRREAGEDATIVILPDNGRQAPIPSGASS